MGTAGSAAVAALNPGGQDSLAGLSRGLGVVLLAVSAVLFIALTIRGLRGRGTPAEIAERLRSPVTGASYATIPGGLNVMGIAAVFLWPELTTTPVGWGLVVILASVGTATALWLMVVFFASAFEHPGVEMRDISGVWFIPETVVLLGALLFSDLARTGPDAAARSLAVLAFALLGAGGLLFAFTAMMFVNRLVLHSHDPRTGVPTVWIMISPLAVTSLALQSVARDVVLIRGAWTVQVSETATFLAAMLWGFALWWIAAAAVITRHAGRAAQTRTASDWAFVFPLAAMVIATLTLARFWRSGLAETIGVVLAVALVAVWLTVAGGSLSRLREERRSPPQSRDQLA